MYNMRLIDADALGIGKARRDAFLIPEYADGWNSAIEHIENAPAIDIKTEVAKEIFAEIEGAIGDSVFYEYSKEFDECIRKNYNGQMLVKLLAELKNKYTKGGDQT